MGIDNQITSYRQCFTTGAGRRVLAHLLIEAGYFDCDLKTTEELAVLNFAKRIIKNMGITLQNVEEFTGKLFEISIGKEM